MTKGKGKERIPKRLLDRLFKVYLAEWFKIVHKRDFPPIKDDKTND